MKNYYQLLSIDANAGSDEIKSAFRREIARYHPDKVAHLGPEFLQIAEGRAAELTEAYRVLMDPAARAQYDAQLHGDLAEQPETASPPPAATRAAATVAKPTVAPASATPTHASFNEERATRDQYVRRAALGRFRTAVASALGPLDSLPARGFDEGFVEKRRRAIFGRPEPPVRVLARFVSTVDGPAVDETWVLAAKAANGTGATATVFLMGSGMAAASELGGRIANLRRKTPPGTAPVLVPVDVRDWDALVPTEAPGAVRAIIDQLKRQC